jgi:hypothetical protein
MGKHELSGALTLLWHWILSEWLQTQKTFLRTTHAQTSYANAYTCKNPCNSSSDQFIDWNKNNLFFPSFFPSCKSVRCHAQCKARSANRRERLDGRTNSSSNRHTAGMWTLTRLQRGANVLWLADWMKQIYVSRATWSDVSYTAHFRMRTETVRKVLILE